MKWSDLTALEREQLVTRVRRTLETFYVPVPGDLELIVETTVGHTHPYDRSYAEGHEAGYDSGYEDGRERGADEGYRQAEKELRRAAETVA